MKRLLVFVIASVFLSGIAAYAHHSFAPTYIEGKTVQIKGRLVQFLMRNPHSFVHVLAPDENGVMQRWVIEWGAPGTLGSQGVKQDTFKAGDEVVITGNPGRDPVDHKMRMLTLRRTSDGYGWGQNPGEVVR